MPLAPELSPHVLYRIVDNQAIFATWRLSTGHEALALFTTADAAKAYQAELGDPADWKFLEPARDKLLDILLACRATGILYAALDPASGSAKTLFDIPKVIASAGQLTVDNLTTDN